MVTSTEYVNRYADDVAFSNDDLYALTNTFSEDTLAFQLFEYIDGAVQLEPDYGATVLMGTENDQLRYPLRVADLRELAKHMEAEEERRQQSAGDGDQA